MNMTTEHKVFIGIGLATLLILVGGVWLISVTGKKEQEKLSKPLIGEEVQVSAGHVSAGAQVTYNTNPPAGGNHYGDSTTHADFYDKAPADGYLVHSLEHGAVILWYKPDITASESANLQSIFNSVSVSKKIMVPRDNLDAPVALTSWGRILKLQTIDENQIKAYMETNEDRGPEKAAI